jgi:choline monooxygenase
MFLSNGRLPHRLAPLSYFDPPWFERELETLFRRIPQCVANRAQLARPGDFVTCDVLGRPVQLRNVDGTIRAYSNVCVHRHCLISSAACGHNAKFRCQYHGWEYDRQGRTAHIPAPKNFAPFDREANRLELYRTELCGDLVFVGVDAETASLRDYLGPNWDVLSAAFGEAWRHSGSWQAEFDVNWKIPVENSVEGYHIPAVHPETFKIAPDSDRTTHVIEDGWTMYRTPNVAPSIFERVLFRFENAAMAILKRSATHAYSQYHLFPNLLISSSDMLSLAVTVLPLGPRRVQLRMQLFTYRGVKPSVAARAVSFVWSQLNRLFTKKVLAEDFAIYPAIQKGLEASEQEGCLGAIEERVHAFQRYVAERMQVDSGRGDLALGLGKHSVQ